MIFHHNSACHNFYYQILVFGMGEGKAKTMSKGKSQGRSQSSQVRFQSGKGFLRRCTTKGKTTNVVYIDVDEGNFAEVIEVDVPESSKKRVSISRMSQKHFLSGDFICIDDDEIKGEGTFENGDKIRNTRDCDANLSNASFPVFSHAKAFQDLNHDDCQIIQERKFPLNFSKNKRTYSEETFPRNRFGLSPLYDSSSSESDYSQLESDNSDCEFMDGPSGKIREQWERAALKKKKFDKIQNDQSGFDTNDPSVSSDDIPNNVEAEKTVNQDGAVPLFSTSGNAHREKSNLPTSTNNENGLCGDLSGETEDDSLLGDTGKPLDDDRSPGCKAQPQEEVQYYCKKDKGKTSLGESLFSDIDIDMRSAADDNDCEHGHQTREEQIPAGPSFWSSHQEAEDEHFWYGSSFPSTRKNFHAEPCWFSSESRQETNFYHEKARFMYEDISLFNNEKFNEKYVDNSGVIHQDKDEEILEKFTCNTEPPDSTNYVSAKFRYEEQLYSGKPSSWSKRQTQVDNGATPVEDEGPVSEENLSCKNQLQNENEITSERLNCQDNEKARTAISQKGACSEKEQNSALKSPCGTPQSQKSPPLHAQDDNVAHNIENDIIGKREKFKETDEFKRAAEEEWASRQRQLQLQAEEAQRLRKRKKAETLRLLDMERRQKQRIEEMRETQKKNVDTINLKEQLRAEVRKELSKLELMHTDMASLLRGLGIHVAGGFYPSSTQVHSAYKQALLRFHPDRASRTDIRQQVEAEEKFKLISRLKGKLLPTP